MPASTLIAPFIGLIAPLVISAVRTPATRIQDRTSRLQYWKSYFEVAALSSTVITPEARHLCEAELFAGQDEAANLQSGRFGWIAGIYTYIAMFFVLAWSSELMQRTGLLQPTEMSSQEEYERFIYVYWTMQGLFVAAAWFGVRWKVRDYLWSAFGPGKSLGKRLTAVVTLGSILAVLIIMYLQVMPRTLTQ